MTYIYLFHLLCKLYLIKILCGVVGTSFNIIGYINLQSVRMWFFRYRRDLSFDAFDVGKYI